MSPSYLAELLKDSIQSRAVIVVARMWPLSWWAESGLILYADRLYVLSLLRINLATRKDSSYHFFSVEEELE